MRDETSDVGPEKGRIGSGLVWPVLAAVLAAVLAVVLIFPKPRRIEATALTIKDRAGVERISLDASGRDGSANVVVRDRRGTAKLILSVEADGTAGVYPAGGGGGP